MIWSTRNSRLFLWRTKLREARTFVDHQYKFLSPWILISLRHFKLFNTLQKNVYKCNINKVWSKNFQTFNSPWGRWRGGGDNFIGSPQTLNFHLPLGGLNQMGGGLKSFTLFFGGHRGFLYRGDGGSPSPTGQLGGSPSDG